MTLKTLLRTGIFMLALLFAVQLVTAQKVLTLTGALETAWANSPDIQKSLLNLERSEQLLAAQNAALKSKFSLNLTPISYYQNREFYDPKSQWYTTEDFQSYGTFTVTQPITMTGGTVSLNNRFGWKNNFSDFENIRSKTFSNNLYLSLNQPLFTYNQIKLNLSELELDLENTRLSYAIQKLNLEKMVTQFFYNVYLAQMSLSIAQDEFANTEKSFEITKNKVDAGLAAKEELYQAELNFATAKSNLQNKRVTLENSKDQFKQYIGMDLLEEIMVATDVEATPVTVDLQKSIDHGLKSRMEIRQREISIESSQFDMIRTKALNEFKADMNLSVGIIGDDVNFGNVYDNPTNNPRVSLAFNIPLWDWGEKKARIKAQEAMLKTNGINLDQEKINIVMNIRRVYRNLQNLVNQIGIAKQNEKNAQLTYEINLERYANGDLTSMDLNLFQTQLSSKKMAYAQSLIDYKIELLNLKIQTLYDFEQNKAIVPEELYKK